MFWKALGVGAIGLGIGTATAGLGAIGGTHVARQEGNAEVGATVGAAAGLSLGVGATVAGFNAGKIGKWAGTNLINGGTALYKKATSVEAIASYVNAGQKVAGAAKTAGGIAASGAGFTGAVGATMAVKAGAKYGNIVGSMFKLNPTLGTSQQKGGLLKMTKRGTAMLGVGAVAKGATEAFNSFNQARAGTSDGQVLTATPDIARSSNMRSAGATGDLAFAMRAQRHG